MHQAMTALVRRAVRSALAGNDAAEDERAAATVEVTDCPDGCDGILTTAAAFPLAQLLRDRRLTVSVEREPTPMRVAQRITELLGSFKEAIAGVRVAGGGHINIDPDPEWCTGLVKEVASSGESMLHADVPAGWSAAEVIRSVLGELSTDGDAELENLRSCALRDSRPADLLTALAACAQPELDVRPYLRSLHGKENVPWYLNRVHTDLARLREIANGWSTATAAGTARCDPGSRLWRWARAVLSYRRAVFVAVHRGRPEAVVRQLLELSSAFYAIFQRPELRDRKRCPLSPAEMSLLPLLIDASRVELTAGCRLLFGDEASIQ